MIQRVKGTTILLLCRQGTYALGIAITLVYAYGEALYPLAIPLTVELLFIFILIVLKIIFDQHMFAKVSVIGLEEDLQTGSDQVVTPPESPLMREASEVSRIYSGFNYIDGLGKLLSQAGLPPGINIARASCQNKLHLSDEVCFEYRGL